MSRIEKIKKIINNRLEKPARIGWTVGLDESKKEGETWTDSIGRCWIKKNGYVRRINKTTKVDFSKTKNFCKSCNMDMTWGNRLDDKAYRSYQMCYECYIQFKTKLKLENKNEIFEKFRELKNKKAFLLDLQSKIKESIDYINSKSSKLEYFNEDGTSEQWTDTMKDTLLKNLKKDQKKCKKELIQIENQLSTIPIESLEKI